VTVIFPREVLEEDGDLGLFGFHVALGMTL